MSVVGFDLGNQNRGTEEIKDQKKALESYIIEMRSKLDDTLYEFATKSEKDQLTLKLKETKNWLDDVGFDETRGAYAQKLDELKKQCDLIGKRYKNASEVGDLAEELTELVLKCRQVITDNNQLDTIMSIIKEVTEKCLEAERWLKKMQKSQERLEKHAEPVLLSADIKKWVDVISKYLQQLKKPSPPKPATIEKPSAHANEAPIEKPPALTDDELGSLTDDELRRKLLDFKRQTFTFGSNLPEDEVEYGKALYIYQKEAKRRKKTQGFKIIPDNEEHYYSGFTASDWSKHGPVDNSVNYLQLLLEKIPTKRNLITRRPSHRTKNLEHIAPSIFHEENMPENFEDEKWLESVKDITVKLPSSVSFVQGTVMKCLKPETCLSIDILDFYIDYIKENNFSRLERYKFNVCRPYFYTKLKLAAEANGDKGDELFRELRRWWSRSGSLFDYSYVVFVVSEGNHFSLGIICMPSKDDKSSLESPRFLHLDSLGCHQSDVIFGYIKWLFEQETKESEAPFRLEDLVLRILKVPKQRNPYDCGLFILKYIERFILDVPEQRDFSKLDSDWFKPEDACALRGEIRDILVPLFNTARDEHKVYLVSYWWWAVTCALEKGVLHTDATASYDCDGIALHLSRRDANVQFCKGGELTYALISKRMFNSACDWHMRNANHGTKLRNSFQLKAIISDSGTLLSLTIIKEENAPEDFEKFSQLFYNPGELEILDFSTKDFVRLGQKWFLTVYVISGQKESKKPAGLPNLGNTCYINSVIQCMAHSPLLASYFIENFRDDLQAKSVHCTDTRFSLEFADLLEKLLSEATVDPKKFNNLVFERSDVFKARLQNDCQEFLLFLLKKLFEDTNFVKSKITDLCKGQCMTSYLCPCGYKSSHLEEFSCFPLPIPKKDTLVSLDDCIELFLERTPLWCEDCKSLRKVSVRKFSILPKYLIFSFVRYTAVASKVETLIEFPVKELDLGRHGIMSGSRYRLYGVINHAGKTVINGHYYAYIQVNGKWYNFNDNVVSHLNEDDIVKKEAYLLFYEKM